MKKNIIVSLSIVFSVILYLIYAVFFEKNPIAIQIFVVFAIVAILGGILSGLSYFFPNSRLAKFLKKLIEWFSEGI